jgi:hypothetical protein
MTHEWDHPLNEEPAQVYAKAMAAIDWLEANPDKQLTGMYAGRDDKSYCSYRSEEATCFCVLGRIAKEAEIRSIHIITPYMKLIGVHDDDVSDLNDDGVPLSQIRDYITRQYEKVTTSDD